MNASPEDSRKISLRRGSTSNRLPAFVFLAFSCFLLLGSCKKNPITPDSEDITRPVIWLNTFEVSFVAYAAGGNPSSQVIKIKNSGQKNLAYSITDDADWLRVEPASGSSTGQLVEHTISIDKHSLAARNEAYSATISVVCAEAYNNPQRVGVTLKVNQEPPPTIGVSPSELSFAAKPGTNPAAQVLRVKNIGQGTLTYTVSADETWLAVNPASGTSSGQERPHTVSVNASGLGEGTYEGSIIVTDPYASNNPLKVKVRLNISEDLAPAIALSPAQLFFQAIVGRNPASQNFNVRNSGGGTLAYTAVSNVAWMSVSPESGTSTGQSNAHRVSINVGGLGAGTRQGVITVSDPRASNSPRQVAVTLELSNLSTDNEISLSCSPSSGRTNDTVTVSISIKGNTRTIDAFGLNFAFDSGMFQYQGIAKGSLTGTWLLVDGSPAGPGTLIIGGFVGSGASIPTGSTGTIAVVTLKVIGVSYNDGYRSQLNVRSYADDITGMKPEPALTYFTFRK
jgi:hypothetical protein